MPKLKPPPAISDKTPISTKSVLFIGAIASVLIIIVLLILFASPDKPALKGENVMYSIYGSNDEDGDYLMS